MLRLKKRGNWWHVAGKNSVGTIVKRHSTECTDKDAAFAYLKSIDDATEWPRKKAVPQTPTSEVPLTVALEKYLKFIWPKTKETTRALYKYDLERYMINPLREIQIVNVSQLTRDHFVDLQHDWLNHRVKRTDAVAKTNYVAVHRRISNTFVNYCVDSGWLAKNPWKTVPQPESDHIATLPLDTDDNHANWKRIRESIIPFLNGTLPELNGKPFRRPSNPLWQNPEAFLTLLELMYETGLRRSDAIMFDPDRLEPTELGNFDYTVPQFKTEKSVTIFLEPWLAEKLKALPRLEPTGLPFYSGTCTKPSAYLNWFVNQPLSKLGKLLGIPGGLRPHRFRDSFAVNFLNAGGSLEDLKELLGHQKVAVTERYYDPKVKSRKKAIEKRLIRARAQQNPSTKLSVVA